MSPPHHDGLALGQQYSLPAATENYEQCYGTYSTLIPPTSAPDSYTSENLYMWQDVDGVYHWADATAARPDNFVVYSPPPYLPPPFSSEMIMPSDYYTHRCSDVGKPYQPVPTQENAYISHLAQQLRTGSSRPQAQDHRSSIARASDSFLAQASSIFSDEYSPSRRDSTLEYLPPAPYQTSPQRDTRPPSRKRSRESLDDGSYHVKEDDRGAHSSSSSTANDACRLPQPHMIVPSQGVPSSSLRIPHLRNPVTSLKTESYAHEHELLLRPDERCTIPQPKHMNNKRVHRSNELVRQESTILSTSTTWPIPDDPITKGMKKAGEQKKQALACLFCRERKIACGRPPAHNPDQTCNQCARRRIKCEYPTESRRGQHKRRRKPTEGESSSQVTSRTNSTSSSMGSTTTLSSSSTTTVTSST